MNSRRIPYFLLGAALAYLPVRTLVTNVSRGNIPEPLWLCIEALPEILVLSALALVIIQNRVQRNRIAPIVVVTCLLLIWSLASIVYGRATLGQGLLGILYNFEGLLALLVLWIAPPRPADRKVLLWTIAGGLGLIGLVAAVESFIGHGFWTWAGLTPAQHFAGPIPQLQSLLSGPNLLASLLVVSSALLLRAKPSAFNWALLAGSGALLGLTYSRSGWIAAAILGIGYFSYVLFTRKSWWLSLRSVALGLAIASGAVVGAVVHQASTNEVLLHQDSTAQHIQASSEVLGSRSVMELTFGHGVGTAGTASIRSGEPVVAENWYLQLIDEIGVIGLLLYAALMLLTLRLLFTQGEPVLGFLAVGLMVQATFLHTWSDGHFLNLAFWLFVGMALVAVPTTVKMKVVARKKAAGYVPARRSRKSTALDV